MIRIRIEGVDPVIAKLFSTAITRMLAACGHDVSTNYRMPNEAPFVQQVEKQKVEVWFVKAK